MLENLDVTLAELVTKVEGLSPKLWEIAMKEVWVDFLCYCIGFIIGTIVLAIGIYSFVSLSKHLKKQKEEENYEISEERVILSILFGAIGCIVGLVLFFGMIYEIGAILINPEYRALEIIMGLIK